MHAHLSMYLSVASCILAIYQPSYSPIPFLINKLARNTSPHEPPSTEAKRKQCIECHVHHQSALDVMGFNLNDIFFVTAAVDLTGKKEKAFKKATGCSKTASWSSWAALLLLGLQQRLAAGYPFSSWASEAPPHSSSTANVFDSCCICIL